ncbi:Nitric oxide dioxygenase [Penicillium hetheringtonii]|uniref:Nitric oxide dioxygenase n=1 Tax=Penicillium hetheringtonii TaxID=911720 RepID=A0AAD6DI03_9EURO|nr:Nitric oxide dioxygenase [Penicillium hetheringtonii]
MDVGLYCIQNTTCFPAWPVHFSESLRRRSAIRVTPPMFAHVKKETGLSQGEFNTAMHPDYVSNIVHDSKKKRNIAKIFHLYKNIFYSPKEKKVISNLNTLVAKLSSNNYKTHIIFKIRNSKIHYIVSFLKIYSDIQITFFTTQLSDKDKKDENHHYTGRINLSKFNQKKKLF